MRDGAYAAVTSSLWHLPYIMPSPLRIKASHKVFCEYKVSVKKAALYDHARSQLKCKRSRVRDGELRSFLHRRSISYEKKAFIVSVKLFRRPRVPSSPSNSAP